MKAGFREREHTADWALEVWAPTFAALLREAARGVEQLSGVEVDEAAPPRRRLLHVLASDPETALIEFLNELFYLRDAEGWWYRPETLTWDGQTLRGSLLGHPVRRMAKEVKAATYHQVQVRSTAEGWRAVFVVDV